MAAAVPAAIPLRRPTGHTSTNSDRHSYAEGTAATSVAPVATLDSHMMNATHQRGHHHDTPQKMMKMAEAVAASAEPAASRRQTYPQSTAEFATVHLHPPRAEEAAAAVPAPAVSAEEP